MIWFILGLLLFLGVHSTRVFAEGWRAATIARIGAQSRQQVPLWDPPAFMLHVTALLMLPVFILFVAAYVPRNGVKARLHHPQVLSVKLWALAIYAAFVFGLHTWLIGVRPV